MSIATRNSSKPGGVVAGSKASSFASANPANPKPSSQIDEEVAEPTVTAEVAKELAKLSALIVETSESHNKKLEEIRRTTSATESKVAEIVSRINDVEGRLCFLEEMFENQKENPLASSAELEALREDVDDMENRERRNNLRFLGFVESCEGKDTVSFLEETIPTLFKLAFPKGLEIERAHRLGPLPRSHDGIQPSRPRPIIARFLRFQDRDRIAAAARVMGNVMWGEHRVMVFPDFSKRLNDKRRKFNECKKLLHEKNIRFSLNYPAVLTVKTPHGPQRFEDHKKAINYIRSLN